MSDDKDKTLAEVLRETPWSAILIPFVLAILVVIAVVVVVFTSAK